MSKMEGSAGRRLAWKEHWRWVSGHSRGPPAPYSGSHGGAPPRASGLLSARRLDQHLGCLSDAGSPNGRSCHKCPEGTERTRSPAEGLAQGGEGCTCKMPRGPSHLGQREPPEHEGAQQSEGATRGWRYSRTRDGREMAGEAALPAGSLLSGGKTMNRLQNPGQRWWLPPRACWEKPSCPGQAVLPAGKKTRLLPPTVSTRSRSWKTARSESRGARGGGAQEEKDR